MLLPNLLRVLTLSAACLAPPVQAGGLADPLDRPALISGLATRAVLLDLAHAGTRLVAVGERGIVLLSDDEGRTWRQAAVPVSVSLTAAAFADARTGWVVGHGGVILKTEDGGEHWRLQLDGRRIAESLAASGIGGEVAAQRWRREGADKPFLAVHADDGKSVLAVGAFGIAFMSRDGGASWTYFGDKLDNPKANHLYAIAVQDGQTFVAGEQGSLFASNDGGASFVRLNVPYKGSLFELKATAQGLFAAGMKGKLLYTADHGRTWQEVANPIPVSLLAAAAMPDGRLLWLNQAGQFLVGGGDGQPLAPQPETAVPAATRIAFAGGKQLVTAGFRGVGIQPWTH